jgi:PIN domain nuclease of toxin-antitoxin system
LVSVPISSGRSASRLSDPFDRMLVAQAGYENIPIVSADPQLNAYGITRIW